jgi:predicted GNAT superfamily acetyltransferase
VTESLTVAGREGPPPAGPGISADVLAAAAARRAGVQVRLVASQGDARRATEVFDKVWRHEGGSPSATPELAWALAHAGNYVALAERDGRAVGASLAFRAADDVGAYLHSHLAGVDPLVQCAGVGYALKLHQRAWALQQRLPRVTWTFDPLVGRNFYFNVTKLGARVVRFYRDFYGPLTDSINNGDESDRCVALWEVGSRRAAGAAAGEQPAVDAGELIRAGAVVVLEPDAAGRPAGNRPVAGPGVHLVRVPPDILALRQSDPGQARAWRLALRAALGGLFEAGFEVTAATRDSWYVFTGGDGTLSG